MNRRYWIVWCAIPFLSTLVCHVRACAYLVSGQKVPSIWHASKNKIDSTKTWQNEMSCESVIETTSDRMEVDPMENIDPKVTLRWTQFTLLASLFAFHPCKSTHFFFVKKRSSTIEHDLQKWISEDSTQFLHTMSRKIQCYLSAVHAAQNEADQNSFPSFCCIWHKRTSTIHITQSTLTEWN